MTEFEGQVLADLRVLKSQMDQVMGLGQPGRLHQIEDRVSCNEQGIQRMKGVVAAFGAGLTMLHLAISYFGVGKHNSSRFIIGGWMLCRENRWWAW